MMAAATAPVNRWRHTAVVPVAGNVLPVGAQLTSAWWFFEAFGRRTCGIPGNASHPAGDPSHAGRQFPAGGAAENRLRHVREALRTVRTPRHLRQAGPQFRTPPSYARFP